MVDPVFTRTLSVQHDNGCSLIDVYKHKGSQFSFLKALADGASPDRYESRSSEISRYKMGIRPIFSMAIVI